MKMAKRVLRYMLFCLNLFCDAAYLYLLLINIGEHRQLKNLTRR
jgi:hypothetical protein